MKDNQKYSQEEMFHFIKQWHESGLPQATFCRGKNIPAHIMHYWHRKYRKIQVNENTHAPNAFLPVRVSGAAPTEQGRIIIRYPNGIELTCPSTLSPCQLQTLVNP